MNQNQTAREYDVAPLTDEECSFSASVCEGLTEVGPGKSHPLLSSSEQSGHNILIDPRPVILETRKDLEAMQSFEIVSRLTKVSATWLGLLHLVMTSARACRFTGTTLAWEVAARHTKAMAKERMDNMNIRKVCTGHTLLRGNDLSK